MYVPTSTDAKWLGRQGTLGFSTLVLIMQLPHVGQFSGGVRASKAVKLPLLSHTSTVSVLIVEFSLPSMQDAPVNDYRPIEVANLSDPSDVGLETRTIGTVMSMPYEVAGPIC